jgi:hypothetical protein
MTGKEFVDGAFSRRNLTMADFDVSAGSDISNIIATSIIKLLLEMLAGAVDKALVSTYPEYLIVENCITDKLTSEFLPIIHWDNLVKVVGIVGEMRVNFKVILDPNAAYQGPNYILDLNSIAGAQEVIDKVGLNNWVHPTIDTSHPKVLDIIEWVGSHPGITEDPTDSKKDPEPKMGWVYGRGGIKEGELCRIPVYTKGVKCGPTLHSMFATSYELDTEEGTK